MRIKAISVLSVTFWLGNVYIVCPSVLSCGNLKLHQTLEVKNVLKQEKIIRTTQPRSLFSYTALLVKVKNSSQKILSTDGFRLSANCQPTVGRQSADSFRYVPGRSVGRLSADNRPGQRRRPVGNLSVGLNLKWSYAFTYLFVHYNRFAWYRVNRQQGEFTSDIKH